MTALHQVGSVAQPQPALDTARSDRAREFLTRWTKEKVHSATYPLDLAEAQRLSAVCLKDASLSGLDMGQITEALGDIDLREFILRAMMAATDASIHIEV